MVERLYDKDREDRHERHQQRMNFGGRCCEVPIIRLLNVAIHYSIYYDKLDEQTIVIAIYRAVLTCLDYNYSHEMS